MELEPVIGLEIHVQLKTKSKMFCSCPNVFGDAPPNSAICPICMGYPGTLPVPNHEAILWARKVGAALNCSLATKSKFDRKSYFYPDLPKGYQISQYDQPLCGEGSVTITVKGKPITIGIERIHLEEDAAKNIHSKGANETLVDYNRAGTPLLEIVTKPDIKTPEEAKLFLQELQAIVRSLEVSDADMEKGHLRCDANISLREKGSTSLNPKTEIKNLNSFRNVERALLYEIDRQTQEWEAGKKPHQATRGFNADTGTTTQQRSKEEAADYRYFPEPDIPPMEFTSDEEAAIRRGLPELPQQKRERFIRQYSISEQQAQLLVEHKELSYFFEDVVSELQQQDKERVDVLPKEVKELVTMAANMILRDIRGLMTEHSLTLAALKITPENFAEVVILLQQGKINRTSLKLLLEEMQRTGGDPDPIIQKLGLQQVNADNDLEKYITDVIEANADIVSKVKAGKDAAIMFLVGEVMAKTRGKANPKMVIELLKKKIAD